MQALDESLGGENDNILLCFLVLQYQYTVPLHTANIKQELVSLELL